jgi:pectin methylesterase-like acyl-CoA thioesterase
LAGGSTSITITVVSASIGDVVYVKNGVYRETLPLRVPAGVTVQGESLRGTEIRPASGTGHQVATITSSSTIATGATNGTYNYVHQTSSSGDGKVLL